MKRRMAFIIMAGGIFLCSCSSGSRAVSQLMKDDFEKQAIVIDPGHDGMGF